MPYLVPEYPFLNFVYYQYMKYFISSYTFFTILVSVSWNLKFVSIILATQVFACCTSLITIHVSSTYDITNEK